MHYLSGRCYFLHGGWQVLCSSDSESLNLHSAWRSLVTSRVGAGREELSLLHLFPQNEGEGLAAGCEMGEKAAAYMLAVSFKIPSDLETWVSHPACLFWSDRLCWQSFAQFAQLLTTLASARLLGVGAGLWGLSESWSWGLLCQGFVLAQNLSMAFYGWCWKGTASSHTAARHLKANYMGPDPMSRLSEIFLNGAVAWKHLVMIPLTKPTWARWLLWKNYLKGKKSVWSLQKQTPLFPPGWWQKTATLGSGNMKCFHEPLHKARII